MKILICGKKTLTNHCISVNMPFFINYVAKFLTNFSHLISPIKECDTNNGFDKTHFSVWLWFFKEGHFYDAGPHVYKKTNHDSFRNFYYICEYINIDFSLTIILNTSILPKYGLNVIPRTSVLADNKPENFQFERAR